MKQLPAIRSTPAEYHLGLRALREHQLRQAQQSLMVASERCPECSEAHSLLAMLSLFDAQASTRERAALHESWAARFGFASETLNLRNQPIRIAYLCHSSTKEAHSGPIEPLLRYHDRKRFVVYGYGCDGGDVYRTTEALQVSDIVAAVRADRIAILVDADGHFHSRSMQVFASRPAPLLVSLCSYPFPRGLPEAVHIPEPLVYQPPRFSPPLRETAPFIRNGFFSFACFTAPIAISPAFLDMFSQIVAGIAGSRFVFVLPHGVTNPDAIALRLQQPFTERGLDPERVAVVGPLARWDRFDLMNEVDLMLDTQPFSDVTSTMDALWMGVPCIACDTNEEPGRGSAAVLRRCGMQDFVATDVSDVQTVATRSAQTLIGRHSLRSEVAHLFRRSTFFDYEAMCGSIEHTVAEAFANISQ